MSKSTRAKRKTLEAVARSEAIKRQQEMRRRPFRSLLYQGKKAVMATQREEKRSE